jgi:uncharacterized protein involved in exopolysaccharide biosynthesis
MATKEITKREARYIEPELEQEILVETQDSASRRQRIIARLSLLWQERKFLFRRAAGTLVVASLLVMLVPVRYTSTTRLMPPDQSGQGIASMLSVLGKSGDLGAIGEQMLGLKTSGDLFVGVIHSRTVQDDLINKFDLRKEYGVRRYEQARKTLESDTDVTSDRKSGIITIKVTDSNRDRAAGMAREYVAALNNVVINLNTGSAHKERVFLEDRLSQVQKDLEAAEKDFSEFASKNTALDVKEQGRAMIGAAAELEGQLIAAETQLQGLQQIYTPENVRVRSMQARVDEYRHQLEKMGGKVPVEGATPGSAQPGESSGQRADLYPSIRELPVLGMTWADLYRKTKIEETVFETLTKQYELAKVEEARETPSVKVLDPADVPEKKSGPPRMLIVGTIVVLVFFCSCAWILVRARWQEVDPSDPGKMLVAEIVQTFRSSVREVLDRTRHKKDA